MTILDLSVPRESENTPEACAQLLASLTKSTFLPNLWQKMAGRQPQMISLEMISVNSQVHFTLACPDSLESFVRSQLLAAYPAINIEKCPLTYPEFAQFSLIKQSAPPYFPLRDYADYKQVDPANPILGILSRLNSTESALVQYLIFPAPRAVTYKAMKYLAQQFELSPDGKPVRELPPEEKQIIKDKISHPLVGVSIRFAATSPDIITQLAGAISVLNRPDGNSLVSARLPFWLKRQLPEAVRSRQISGFLKPASTLNVLELSSLWHLPGVYTKIPNINWAASVQPSEPPDNLPLYSSLDVNFFATCTYRNAAIKFGLKQEDRLRHMYVLGKSGTGKSTLLENMAVDDFKKGRGIAFIDPHGDSIQNLLNYIPKQRINHTVYFNPADRSFPITLNILEVENPDQAELVVSGIISIFHKLYGKFWGPRMQYILRNALLTLASIPGSTLVDIIKVLSDYKFRSSLYPSLDNTSLLHFWRQEFDTLEEKTRLEYTYPILNKIGQFVNSPLIQPIISSPKSSINLQQIMNSGHIFLANLSQGRLGEDNATLLGAMLITKFQLASLNRIDTPTSQRQDYLLFVDEFQNFVTESFTKILSEARKFRLGLVLANQYIAQIPETIQQAIFGNVGTLVSFNVGAEDARVLAREFSPVFDENSLLNLQKYQVVLKMTIDGQLSRPFSAFTLPPLKSVNLGKNKVIEQSRRRYGRS